MLSIRFDSKTEWWVSSGIFERLVEAALQDSAMPPHLEEWYYIAVANGGMDVSRFPPVAACGFVAALRSTAEREVQRLRDAGATTPDGSYRIGLQRLLTLLHTTQ
jgi:hypothetical protein